MTVNFIFVNTGNAAWALIVGIPEPPAVLLLNAPPGPLFGIRNRLDIIILMPMGRLLVRMRNIWISRGSEVRGARSHTAGSYVEIGGGISVNGVWNSAGTNENPVFVGESVMI